MEKIYEIAGIIRSVIPEGVLAGKPVTIVKFSHCNLSCPWCDSPHKHVLETYTTNELIDKIKSLGYGNVLFTGGEPSLQLDSDLLNKLRDDFFLILETNGTKDISHIVNCLDWIRVSPKSADGRAIKVDNWVVRDGDEVILPFPDGVNYDVVKASSAFLHKWVSPIRDGVLYKNNMDNCLNFVLDNPGWRIAIDPLRASYFAGEGKY